jgi:phosphoesterase RecJ-like protein
MPHEAFREFVDAHLEFLVTSHVDPDGDALGSSLGLALALRQIGRTVIVVNESPVPELLRFLPGSETVRKPEQVPARFAAAFVLDCSSLDRAGSVAARCLAPGAAIANIDHHWGNDTFGKPRLVNVEASATAELVFDVLEACHVPVTPEVAECLYTGLLSDTGGFRYANTTSRALRLAARLVDRGARAAHVAEMLYARKSEASLRILGLALTSLESRQGGQVGALTISREMFERAGATPEDADGIVQYAKSLVGARVGILIQEIAPEEVRVSLRSDGSVDVNEVAAGFGGGGHKNAAGLRALGSLGEIRGRLFAAIEQAMNGGPPSSRG